MGRIFIELDPEGYDRLEEHGFSKSWTGADLMEWLSTTRAADQLIKGNFWNPPKSQWVLPRPKQFDPDWHSNSVQMPDYLIRATGFTPATGIGVLNEYDPSNTPGGGGAGVSYRTTFYVPSSGVTSLLSINFTNLGTAAGVVLPADVKVVATIEETPNGDDLSAAAGDFHPHIDFLQYPIPQEHFIFGWGQCAVLWSANRWSFLTTSDGGTNWTLRETRPIEGEMPGTLTIPSAGVGGGAAMNNLRPVHRQFMAVPIGLKDLWISFLETSVLIPDFNDSGSFFDAGEWWIATAPSTKVDVQVQVVGYNSAGTDLLNPPSTTDALEMFNLGPNYMPTEDPGVTITSAMHIQAGVETLGTVRSGNEWTSSVSGGTPASTEQIQVGVKDEDYDDWVSDGTHFKGSLRIVLRPDTAQRPAYVAPALQYVTLNFPQKRTARARTGVILDDTQWSALSVSTSLRDPDGKRITFIIRDKWEELLSAGNYHIREGYPVHILHETVPDTPASRVVIARGWVHQVKRKDIRTESTDNPLANVRDRRSFAVFTFTCRGLLSRAAEQFLHPPTMVNPDDVEIEHDFAIKEALKQAAFDVTDTDFFYFYPDPWTGQPPAQLPRGESTGSLKSDGAHHPDWNEQKLQYCHRIATEWRGWVFYETDTLVKYHPDLAWVTLQPKPGVPYVVSGILARTQAEATSLSIPNQWMLLEPECEIQPMQCNCIRISGKAPEEESQNPNRSKHVLEKFAESISDVSSEHFLGEERILAIVSKLAISLDAMKQLARVLRYRFARRIIRWTAEAPFVPHQITSNCEVGRVWTFKGRGNILLDNVEWTILGPSETDGYYVGRTRMSGEKLTSGATVAELAETGGFPGQGAAEE